MICYEKRDHLGEDGTSVIVSILVLVYIATSIERITLQYITWHIYNMLHTTNKKSQTVVPFLIAGHIIS